jgi:hypothetical protein
MFCDSSRPQSPAANLAAYKAQPIAESSPIINRQSAYFVPF